MSFLKPRVCFAYILHHHSVSWDMIPLKFSSWNITLWTERVHQSTNFQIFQCFNESSPKSSYQVWNHKIKTYSNFASLFSVIKYKSSVFFILNRYTLDEKTRRSEIFNLLIGWVKIHQIPYVIFETASQFFFKLCISLQCHER